MKKIIISISSLLLLIILVYIIFHFTANTYQKCLYLNTCEDFFEEEIEQLTLLDDSTLWYLQSLWYTQDQYTQHAYDYISDMYKVSLQEKITSFFSHNKSIALEKGNIVLLWGYSKYQDQIQRYWYQRKREDIISWSYSTSGILTWWIISWIDLASRRILPSMIHSSMSYDKNMMYYYHQWYPTTQQQRNDFFACMTDQDYHSYNEKADMCFISTIIKNHKKELKDYHFPIYQTEEEQRSLPCDPYSITALVEYWYRGDIILWEQETCEVTWTIHTFLYEDLWVSLVYDTSYSSFFLSEEKPYPLAKDNSISDGPTSLTILEWISAEAFAKKQDILYKKSHNDEWCDFWEVEKDMYQMLCRSDSQSKLDMYNLQEVDEKLYIYKNELNHRGLFTYTLLNT